MSFLKKYLEVQQKEVSEIKESTQKAAIELTSIRSDLNYHIKRTNMLEDQQKKLQEEFKPIKVHVAVTGALFKGSLAVLGGAAAVAGIVRLFIL